MIYLQRPPQPEMLSEPWAQEARQQLIDKYHFGSKQDRHYFHYKDLYKLKTFLHEMTHGKCAYCETRIVLDQADLELFRPRSVYWWLAYDWDNMLLSCRTCNQRFKLNQFPVMHGKDPNELVLKPVWELDALERPILVDPCLSPPEPNFAYSIISEKRIPTPDDTITISGISVNGQQTVELLGLNRPDLIQGRMRAYLNALREIPSAFFKDPDTFDELELMRIVEKFKDPKREFAGMLKYLLTFDELKKVAEARAFKDYLDRGMPTTRPIPAEPRIKFKPKPHEIGISKFIPTQVEISNFKSVTHLQFSFRNLEENRAYAQQKFPGTPEPPMQESWVLLLGENGVGKSSVLQAIILALLPDERRKELVTRPADLVQKGKDSGYVEIHVDGGGIIRMDFDKDGNIHGNVSAYNDYLLAYGCTRLLPKNSIQPETPDGKIKVKNFFDYTVALEDSEKWLLALSDEDFDQAALFLKDLLFLNKDLTRRNGRIYTQEHDREIEVGLISDGYKTLLALAVDMLKTFATQENDRRYRDVQAYARGIVLIDEIGTHLHPRWKMLIVERLRNALPNVFFIVTTHEPLCLRGLRDKEVLVLRQDPVTKAFVSLTDLPNIEGLRVDQLLTSQYFGLNSTMQPEAEVKFEQYYKLLATPVEDRSPADQDEIDKLTEELKDLKQLGTNIREELFYYVIDQVVATSTRNGFKMDELKQEVMVNIKAFIDTIDSLPNDTRTPPSSQP